MAKAEKKRMMKPAFSLNRMQAHPKNPSPKMQLTEAAGSETARFLNAKPAGSLTTEVRGLARFDVATFVTAPLRSHVATRRGMLRLCVSTLAHA